MRNHVRHSRSVRTAPAFEEGHERDLVLAPVVADDLDGDEDADGYAEEVTRIDFADAEGGEDDFADDVVRLSCPDCGRPISVLAEDLQLPQHALCPTPWNPFGLTVCAGSGRAVAEGRPLEPAGAEGEGELVVLLALPAGLDWRTQPFSHVGGPGSRPMRVPTQRLAA